MPSLDAVIPAYNPAPGWLDRAVASLAPCAAFGLRRIIIVDDGSEPAISPPRLLHTVDGVSPPSIELIRRSNAGPSAARNTAFNHLRASPADWILLLDADDRVIPEGVRAMLDLAIARPSVGVLPARVHVRDLPNLDRRPEPGVRHEQHRAGHVPPEWADKPLPAPADVFRPISLFSATGALVLKRCVDQGLRFDESLRLGEDREFFYRLALLGPILVSSRPAVIYAEHGPIGANLTSPAHFQRRVRDHVALMDRYAACDPASRPHFDRATRWLINACSKSGVDRGTWTMLIEAARRHGCAVPVKSRLRRAIRSAIASIVSGLHGRASEAAT